MTQAGNYAMVLHYLKALEALGGNPHDGAKVVAKMKEIPTDDPLFGKGPLRADGRRIIPAYLFEVKKPDELKYPWDYYKLVATISPEDAAVRSRKASARSSRNDCDAASYQGGRKAPSRRAHHRSAYCFDLPPLNTPTWYRGHHVEFNKSAADQSSEALRDFLMSAMPASAPR